MALVALSDVSLGCATEAPDAAPADASLEAVPEHPYPCECCTNTHGNESGFCDACSRRVGLPPGVAKRFALFRRRAQLLLITLTMSFFETDDQALLVVFCGSVALICAFYFVARVVASPDKVLGWIVLVLVVGTCGLLAKAMPDLVRAVEAVDAIKGLFDAAREKLLAGRSADDLGPASRKPDDAAALQQSTASLREIYTTVQRLRPAFEAEVLRVLARHEAESPREQMSNVKRLFRARQKTAMDYGGNFAMLRDVLRGSVVCRDADDFQKCFRGLAALERDGVVEIVSIKNRVRDGALSSGYVDANVVVRFRGLLCELQLHLKAIVDISHEHHDAYEAGRELDLMGVLEEAPALEDVQADESLRARGAYDAARCVPAVMSLVIAVLYVDAFVLKGAPVIVERAELLPLRGFSAPYALLRCYGVVLAAPYLAVAYVLLRATGLLGEASREAQKQKKTRISLLYDRYFGYEGSLFVWKVFVFQLVEVGLQAFGKLPFFLVHLGPIDKYGESIEEADGGKHKRQMRQLVCISAVFHAALAINVAYPALLLHSRRVVRQRDCAFAVDTLLDVVYAVVPFTFVVARVSSQSLLIPHEPVHYTSNLVPMLHAHFVISTLEIAHGQRRELRRTASEKPSGGGALTKAAIAARERPLPGLACILFLLVGSGLLVYVEVGSLKYWEFGNCPPCDCAADGLLKSCDVYSDAVSLVWSNEDWNRELQVPDLELEWDGITKIKPGAFDGGLDSLEYLSLYGNEISRLEAGTFEGVETIDWLELGDNAISAIEAGAFEFECLHRLDLDFNTIASLEQTFEFPGAECLIILDLNENSMTTIDSGVFSNLNRLRWLDLGMNSISSLSVGAFDGLESLAVLFLYGNYLTRLEADTFENLTSLAVLDLWWNDVRSIDEGTFDGLDLTELNLEGNQALSTLPHSLLDMTNLRAVHLYNTSICANDTPALDPAFDDLVERGVLSCEETDTGSEYYRQQYLASEIFREEYSYNYYE